MVEDIFYSSFCLFNRFSFWVRPYSIVKCCNKLKTTFYMTSNNHFDLLFIFFLVTLASCFLRRQDVLDFLSSLPEIIRRKKSWYCLPPGNSGLEETEGNWVNGSHETVNKEQIQKMCKKSKKREFGDCEVSRLHNCKKFT